MYSAGLSRKNTQLNTLKTEIDIFFKLFEKEKIFVDHLEYFISKEKEFTEEQKKKELEQLARNKEQYLNTLDMICFYVDKKHFTPSTFYRQYGKTMLEIKDILADINEYKNIALVLDTLQR